MLDFLNAQQCPPVGLHPSEVLCGDEPRVKLLSAVKASRHGKGNRRMPNRGREKTEAECFKARTCCISRMKVIWFHFITAYVLYVLSRYKNKYILYNII